MVHRPRAAGRHAPTLLRADPLRVADRAAAVRSRRGIPTPIPSRSRMCPQSNLHRLDARRVQAAAGQRSTRSPRSPGPRSSSISMGRTRWPSRLARSALFDPDLSLRQLAAPARRRPGAPDAGRGRLLPADVREAPQPRGPARDPPAMFVLDRQRLATLHRQRRAVRQPVGGAHAGRAGSRALGVKRLFYVGRREWRARSTTSTTTSSADHAAGIAIALARRHGHRCRARRSTANVATGRRLRPRARGRRPSRAASPGEAGPRRCEFGTVPVVLGLVGGTLLGVAWSRSGTWNRGGGVEAERVRHSVFTIEVCARFDLGADAARRAPSHRAGARRST